MNYEERNLTTHTKRNKKKRTRKILDDMRKRSFHNTTRYYKRVKENEMLKHDNINKLSGAVHCLQPVSLITSKRLTLKFDLHTKTVKSETITRDMLKDGILQFPNNVISSLGIKITKEHQNLTKAEESADIFNHEYDENALSRNSFTEIHKNEESFMEKISETESIISISMSSTSNIQNIVNTSISRTSRDDCYLLYEDFMQSIPTYLNKYATNVIKKNNINQKTKHLLQDIYFKNVNRTEIQPNAKNCNMKGLLTPYNETARPMILENPIEYIRQNYFDKIRRESQQSPPPPGHRAVASCSAFIDHTPEYIYYARKLN